MKSPNPNSGIYKAESTKTLDVHGGNPNCNQGGICIVENKGLYDVRISSEGVHSQMLSNPEENFVVEKNVWGFEPGCAMRLNPENRFTREKSPTLRANMGDNQVAVVYSMDRAACRSADDDPKDCNFTKNYGEGKQIPYTQQSISEYKNCGVASSLMARDYKSPKDLVCFSLDRAAYNQGINAKYDFAVKEDETMTLVARGPSAICECASDYKGINNQYVADDKCIVEPYQKMVGTLCASDYKEEQPMVTKKNEPRPIVRRLTPLECERLQGFPDGWTDIGDWIDTKGKLHKGDSDTPRYKALGNSIALPFWGWMAKRMCAYLKEPTMASLFDGIGGFPLVYSQAGCKPIWASEIEEFPIAVTKRRFGED